MKFGLRPADMDGLTLGEWNKIVRYLELEEREHRRANRG